MRRCVWKTCHNNENIPFGLLFLLLHLESLFLLVDDKRNGSGE